MKLLGLWDTTLEQLVLISAVTIFFYMIILILILRYLPGSETVREINQFKMCIMLHNKI